MLDTGTFYFGSNNTITSTANQEIIQQNKPEGFVGTFSANSVSFKNEQDCTVKVNGSTPIDIPAGGFTWDTPITTLEVVEGSIAFDYTGSYVIQPYNIPDYYETTKVSEDDIVAIAPFASLVQIAYSGAYQIGIIGIRSEIYTNTFGISGCAFYSNTESVATVSNSGLVTYVSDGEATITITFGKLTAFLKVVCG